MPALNTAIVVASFAAGALAVNNGLARTPQMGWVRQPQKDFNSIY
jgi:hypothetical protein